MRSAVSAVARALGPDGQPLPSQAVKAAPAHAAATPHQQTSAGAGTPRRPGTNR